MATFIFYLVLINLLLCLSVAQRPFLYHFCVYDRGNYTTSSTYQTSLNRLLSSLPSNASANGGFYGASVADNDSTTISAIALCRGDVTPTDCRSCVNDSNVLLLRRCPNQVEAIGWYDNCMLRFSNRTILGGVSESLPSFRMENPNNYSGNVSQFNQVLGNLMEELQTRAAAGGQLLKFTTGKAAVTSFDRVYGLVQCTPDLSQLSCSNCLGNAIAQIPNYLNGRKGGRYVGPSCNIRFEQYQFYDDTSDAAPPPAAPPPNNSTTPTTTTGGRSDKSTTAIIAVSTTVSGILVIVFAFFWWRKRQKRELQSQNPEDIINVESLQFDFGTIRVATDNFSQANKLGQGGFGAVYKGKLPNGQDVAVKRLSMDSGQGDQEFKNEVLLVAKLQHRNLVRLLGFSLKGNERLLIYEYVPNTSLDHFIFDPVKRLQLDFDRRYKIIGGIARGLLYLHEDSRLRIIHRDLKASNILLDEGMNAKISDFGMARLFVVDQTQGNTSRVVGTYGYMAPEYAFHGLFSVKSDVFSFGVLVLEIVSGQKNISFRSGGDLTDLLSHAWRSWREGSAVNLVDPSLRNYSSREIMRCVHIGLLCVQENVAERPTMASVVVMLSSHSSTLPMPSEPAFLNYTSTESGARLVQNSSGKTRSDSSQREFENFPLNSTSNSELYPR